MNNKFDQNKRSSESSSFLPPPPFLYCCNEMKYRSLFCEISFKKLETSINARINLREN